MRWRAKHKEKADSMNSIFFFVTVINHLIDEHGKKGIKKSIFYIFSTLWDKQRSTNKQWLLTNHTCMDRFRENLNGRQLFLLPHSKLHFLYLTMTLCNTNTRYYYVGKES